MPKEKEVVIVPMIKRILVKPFSEWAGVVSFQSMVKLMSLNRVPTSFPLNAEGKKKG